MLMKIKFSYGLVLVAAVAAIACNKTTENNKPVPEGLKSFVIKGTLKNFKGTYLQISGLNLEEQRWLAIDSVKPEEDGDYEIKVTNAIPDFYVLRINDTISQSIIADNAEMEFSADVNDFEKTKEFKYTKANTALIDFSKSIAANTAEMKRISKVVNTLMQKGKFDSINVYQKAFETEKVKVKNIAKVFINEQIPSISVFALIDQFSFDQDFNFLDSLSQRMQKEMPASKYTKMLSGQFEKIKGMKDASAAGSLGEGKAAPEFELPTPEGKKIKLSSFKGKVLLLDFWASWCKPCRAENPNVVRLYEKFKGKNFDILSVSLDENKEAWIKAIADDNLTWTHLSDLGGWESAVVPSYGLQAIPSTYLLDAQGVIIAVNLRGEALEQKLTEVLK